MYGICQGAVVSIRARIYQLFSLYGSEFWEDLKTDPASAPGAFSQSLLHMSKLPLWEVTLSEYACIALPRPRVSISARIRRTDALSRTREPD